MIKRHSSYTCWRCRDFDEAVSERNMMIQQVANFTGNVFRRARFQLVAVVTILSGLCVFGAQAASTTNALDRLENVHRIVFLGDSITYAGHYVEDIEAYYVTCFPDHHFEFLNLGLPSETVSGLSEPGHAGGKFPRPDLHWRLNRVLEKARPDLVFACYGMNDGIYLPFSDERFQKFKDGMEWLHEQVVAPGAKLIHVTPPTFDGVTARALKKSRGKPASSPPYE